MQQNKVQNLPTRNSSRFPSRNCISFLLLATIITISYSNSLHNFWHLDDIHTIIRNPKLHLTNLSTGAIGKTLHASTAKGYYNSNKLYRPIPNLTFALNWFFGQKNVTGYHIVNIVIHCFTAFVLLLTIQLLLLTPNCRTGDNDLYNFIPLLSAVLWAINPIQVSAVTYIVQRMAMLATLFTIASIFFYLKARLSCSIPHKIIYTMCCFIGFMLAMGSKENSVMLPFSLGLIELLFFQNLNSRKIKKILLWVAGLGLLGIITFITMYILQVDLIKHFTNYSNRSFTMNERLLTESRVIIFYLSLIFYPLAERFSIQHDFILSTSILSPPSTLLAILLIISLIFIAIQQSNKRPIISLGILFYFLNHLIESSIIPLELIFQHRNYLPTLFIYMPISLMVYKSIEYFRGKKITCIIIVIFYSLIIAMIALGTYSRNKVWYSDESLWQDVNDKYPNLFRPYIILSQTRARRGDLNGAIALLQRALELSPSSQSPKRARTKALNQIAIYHFQKGELDRAIENSKQALEIIPKYDIIKRTLIKAYIAEGAWTEARKVVDEVLARRPNAGYYLKSKGFILLKHGKPKAAIPFLVEAGRQKHDDWQVPMFIGSSLDKFGKHKQALWFLKRAHGLAPNNQIPLMGIIQNRLAVAPDAANKYVKRLLADFDTEKIKYVLRDIKTKHIYPPIQTDKISKAIATELETRLSDFQ